MSTIAALAANLNDVLSKLVSRFVEVLEVKNEVVAILQKLPRRLCTTESKSSRKIEGICVSQISAFMD